MKIDQPLLCCCLVFGLGLTANVLGAPANLTSPAAAVQASTVRVNPYKAISIRNVFRLITSLPKPQLVSQPPPPAPSPVKLTLTGVMDIGGPQRALVEMSAPGQPGRKMIVRKGDWLGEFQVVTVDVSQGRVLVRRVGEDRILRLSSTSAAGSDANSLQQSGKSPKNAVVKAP